MSIIDIPQILETRLALLTPELATAKPNSGYVPVTGTPYQRIDFLNAKPSNNFIHRGYIQKGYMQVTLLYPQLGGALAIRTRAQLIRDHFKSGAIYSGVHIASTPEIGNGNNEGDRYVIPILVYFSQKNSEA